ncbi:hypothetical protein AWM70_22245 [Paenibacillus yonginensis]|uniref:Uncharacterized protein n=1 Tax=Paenibacillus yonginensis TaxID=1462996 RepID=A0A1B1N6E4_9BACL|nr:hypothetical protein [Paenibacillus yonginensis]ANS76967.1 hypothetical protein AWM70_22245 [Paenibacillus yonginensis]
MRPIQGMIDLETIEIFLEAAEERLKIKSLTIYERFFLYGMITAYRDFLENHKRAWRTMK